MLIIILGIANKRFKIDESDFFIDTVLEHLNEISSLNEQKKNHQTVSNLFYIISIFPFIYLFTCTAISRLTPFKRKNRQHQNTIDFYKNVNIRKQDSDSDLHVFLLILLLSNWF